MREKDKDDDEEEDIIMDDKEKEKDKDADMADIDAKIKADIIGPESVFTLNLREEDKIGDDDKLLLGYKRKRKKKEKVLKEAKKRKARPKPSEIQEVFNLLQKKEVINEDAVKGVASLLNYRNLTPQKVNFFVTLGKARASLQKFGIPSAICKNPFHCFVISDFYNSTNTFTNDAQVWKCYFWRTFAVPKEKGGLSDFKEICEYSVVKEFSIATDKLFKVGSVESGYVQDFSSKIALICPRRLNEKEMAQYADAITNKAGGTIAALITSPNEKKGLYLFQYDTVIIVSNTKENIGDLIKATGTVICVNSKNKLENGLKTLNVDTNMGSYINVHDMKTADFSPASLFITPAVNKPKLFVKAILDTNNVYNTIAKNIKNYDAVSKIGFPDNSIFWDNLESFIQLIGFLKLVNSPSEKLSVDMFIVIDTYYRNRETFTTWKRIYNSFESIVLSFYDKIVGKISVDNIVSLQNKVGKFISDYIHQRDDKDNIESVRDVINKLPGATMMKNFVNTGAALELMYAISKLISLLKKGETDNVTDDMSVYFKTVGYLCSQVLFDGSVSMIPKIRSKIAFLGGLSTDLSKDQFNSSVKYLVDSFKDSVANYKNRVEGAGKPDVFQAMNDIDNLMNKIIKNTITKLDSDYLNRNADDIADRVMADKALLENLRENLNEMLSVNTAEQLERYANFLEDDTFVTFLKTIAEMADLAVANGADIPVDEILQTMKTKKNAKKQKKMVFKKSLGRKKDTKVFDIKKAKKTKSLKLNSKKLIKMIEKIPQQNKEKFQNGLKQIIKDSGEVEA